MPRSITSLLADLQRVMQQISDENGREEGQRAEPETDTQQPGKAPAATDIRDENGIGEVDDTANRHLAGVVIGIDAERNSTTKLEQVEVMPEPDDRVTIAVRAKRDQ